VLSILRQPRYLRLAALMLVVAVGCAIAGTWQVYRFAEKHSANNHLRHDAHAAPAPVAAVLGPAAAPTSTGDADKFRVVTASGHYLPQHETLLRGQTTDGNDIGYFVITPLDTTANGVLLIARGFIPQNNAADKTPPVPPAPTGPVSVSARLEPGDTKADKLGQLPSDQIDTVNAAEQSARIGQPVWNGYATLLANQAGGAGLQAIPDPDLSNPAGGAEEPQHLAYVVQWYLFALLALSAPLVMARAELRRDDQPHADRPAGPATVDGDAAAKQHRPTRRERRASLDDRLAGRA